MPTAPTGICRDCSSRALSNGYCSAHQVKNSAAESRAALQSVRYDPTVTRLYKTARWQRTRRTVFKRDVLCVSCGNRKATDCDHIVSAKIVLEELGLTEFFSPERCQGLCHSCHSKKTAFEVGWAGHCGTMIKQEEFADASQITVICGLAGSGKTTYVAAHKQPTDAVFDYDVELARATGLEVHQSIDGCVKSILAQRDAFIRDVIWNRKTAWIIVARRDAEIVKRLVSAGATLVELRVDTAVRVQRLSEREQQ